MRLAPFGVADRAGATVFHWLFVLMSLTMPASMLLLPGRATTAQRLVYAVALGLSTGLCVWNTARAIEWADRHGRDRVP